MERFPLYPDQPTLPLETEHPLDRDQRCARCPLHKRMRLKNVCLPAAGDAGEDGVLVVSDYPGKIEDAAALPFTGDTGQYIRRTVSNLTKRPVAYDNALKCYPGGTKSLNRPIQSCRCYLAATVRDVKPRKILAMGQWAIYAVLGRTFPLFSVKHAYTWMGDVRVHMMMNPVNALRNRFLRERFEDELNWALNGEPMYGPPWKGSYWVVRTEEEALEAAASLRQEEWITYDVETAGVPWKAFQMLCVSLSPASEDHAFVWSKEGLADPGALRVLKDLLTDRSLGKVGSNVKYDQIATEAAFGFKVKGVVGDTRLLRKILDADADADLETMGEMVGMGGHKEEAQVALGKASRVVGKLAKRNMEVDAPTLFQTTPGILTPEVTKLIAPGDNTKTYSYGLIPEEMLLRYNARDTVTTSRLYNFLLRELNEDHSALTHTYQNIVMPASQAFKQVEVWGIRVDKEALEQFALHLQLKKDELQERLKMYGGFNPEVPAEVAEVLFNQLKLPPQKKTDNGNLSVDKEALWALQKVSSHPVIQLILDWRHVSKMDGTYATGMLRHIRGDGRIHPNILLDGARSGRPSCSGPNMQNLPRADESAEGKMARDCFAAEPGYTIIQADYSQLELRVAAMLSGDQEMRRIFDEGHDYHQRTAELIAPIAWGIKAEDVIKRHRSAAKAFNFGILYGMSDGGIAHRAHCSVKEAANIREAVFGRFKVLARWIKERLNYARRYGYCWTWWDGQNARRRPLYRIAEPDDKLRSTAENSSFNTPIQGSGSDFLVKSLVEVVNWIQGNGIPAKVLMTIHDSIMMEVRNDTVGEVLEEVPRLMTQWNSLGVPVVVDTEVGQTWGSLEKVK